MTDIEAWMHLRDFLREHAEHLSAERSQIDHLVYEFGGGDQSELDADDEEDE